MKGTQQIREMLEPFKDVFEIRISEEVVPHEANLARIAECHIYIEMFKPTLNGKPYGCYGVTAFEAAALGCFVVTNNLHKEVYTEAYGSSPFAIANTEIEFLFKLRLMTGMNTSEFEGIKLYDDFYTKHSIEATGRRILKLITE